MYHLYMMYFETYGKKKQQRPEKYLTSRRRRLNTNTASIKAPPRSCHE